MASAEAEPSAPSDSGPSMIIGIAVSLVLGVIAGGGFGFVTMRPAKAPQPEVHKAEPIVAPAEGFGRFPLDAVEQPVEPIIATIGPDFKTNIRLDLSIIVASGTTENGTLSAEIREDALAYLKGLKLSDFEGGRSFQNLREQLDDRARIRGRGVVLGMLISGLVVQ